MEVQDKEFEMRLIASANDGDAEAMEILYFEYRSWVAAVAYHFCQNHSDAQEVTQDAFTYFFKQFPGFTLTASLKSYLYPVIRNKSIDLIRKRKPLVSSELLAESPSGDLADHNQVRDRIRDMVAELPVEQRDVVILRFADGFSLKEIATKLIIPLGTVKSRLHNGLSVLKSMAMVILILLLNSCGGLK